MAQCGLTTTICDWVPNALQRAAEAARAHGVPLTTLQHDLERDGLPAGPWDVILSYHFLSRPLFGEWRNALSESGILVFVQPTLRNLERHPHPSRRFLLAEGEGRTLLDAAELEPLHYEEGWLGEGRHEVYFVAKRR